MINLPDGAELQRLIAGSSRPGSLDRVARVRLLVDFAQELMAERMPSREAILFGAGGLLAWLQHGGNLTGDFWKVHQRGSHQTPQAIWRSLIADEDRTISTGNNPAHRSSSSAGDLE